MLVIWGNTRHFILTPRIQLKAVIQTFTVDLVESSSQSSIYPSTPPCFKCHVALSFDLHISPKASIAVSVQTGLDLYSKRRIQSIEDSDSKERGPPSRIPARYDLVWGQESRTKCKFFGWRIPCLWPWMIVRMKPPRYRLHLPRPPRPHYRHVSGSSSRASRLSSDFHNCSGEESFPSIGAIWRYFLSSFKSTEGLPHMHHRLRAPQVSHILITHDHFLSSPLHR